jgi:ketosteroid isomerase-like protein
MGGWIRNGIKGDARHVLFKTTTLTADGELLSEIGTAEGRSDNGELKYSFRYLVVWKKENGIWKLYRDVGL